MVNHNNGSLIAKQVKRMLTGVGCDTTWRLINCLTTNARPTFVTVVSVEVLVDGLRVTTYPRSDANPHNVVMREHAVFPDIQKLTADEARALAAFIGL